MTATTETIPLHRKQLQINGATFHVLEQGSGPAVLFCHGFPDTAETWRSQMRAVAAAGYRAVAPDMRGFGGSYAPDDVALYTSLHVAGDLIGILDALGIESAVVVGHDWGADYAQRLAVMRPDRVRAVVSLSIPFAPRGDASLWDQLGRTEKGRRYYAFDLAKPEADQRLLPASETIPSVLYWLSASPPPGQRWDPVNPALHMLRPAPAPDWVDPGYVRHTVETFTRTGFHGGLNYYRVLQITFDLTAAFKGALIHQPSLYIWGAADGLCRFFHPETPTLEDLRRVQPNLLDQIRLEDTGHWVQPNLLDQIRLEDTGHWVQHEAAAEVNDALLRFLDEVGA